MKNRITYYSLFFYVTIIFLFIRWMPLKAIDIPQKYSVTYFSSKNGVEDGLVNDIIQDHKVYYGLQLGMGFIDLMAITLRIISRIQQIKRD